VRYLRGARTPPGCPYREGIVHVGDPFRYAIRPIPAAFRALLTPANAASPSEPAPHAGQAGNSYAFGINSAAQVVGWSETPDGVRAFLYSNGTMTNLGSLGGWHSSGLAINETADIAGYICTTNGAEGILFTNGQVIAAGSPYNLCILGLTGGRLGV
jgi:probable HAF family extracellular repeat protein